ncbi:hypothetical protein BUALT_Bualt16G0043900 [Buddleja alternifolia]|uniref:DDE Tnp4 domain-containing protein n=1 Tax=Buddleja alternifolia TaxID=168488 RepID=A0AAV6WF97_9LAMI|nr:hypothetical protein BUALT_Bualt16G0043900 [Buddleja alternifolia]
MASSDISENYTPQSIVDIPNSEERGDNEIQQSSPPAEDGALVGPMDVSTEHQAIFVLLQEIESEFNFILQAFYREYRDRKRRRCSTQVPNRLTYSLKSKIPKQIEYMHDLISYNDETCINNLRMSRNAFGRLCFILENVGGLSPTKNVLVSEQVAIFLSVLAHHMKNRIVKHHFKRSGYTISTHFNNVLTALLKLHTLFLVKPVPIEADCRNERWKRFKGCLGALDGTYIPLRVAQKNKARYRNRKGDVSTNVLAVCDINMNYIYLLCGWEGSAADSRVLKDAINRQNGLKVPQGNYYLCDSGYTNGEGFLSPYRGVRYHIQEWNAQRTPPQNAHELFNKVHASARNVIERSFALLKGRWAILRSNSFYPVKVQNRCIMACALLHNYIRLEMPFDLLEAQIVEVDDEIDDDPYNEFIDQVEPSQQWTNWRESLATMMFDEWRVSR